MFAAQLLDLGSIRQRRWEDPTGRAARPSGRRRSARGPRRHRRTSRRRGGGRRLQELAEARPGIGEPPGRHLDLKAIERFPDLLLFFVPHVSYLNSIAHNGHQPPCALDQCLSISRWRRARKMAAPGGAGSWLRTAGSFSVGRRKDAVLRKTPRFKNREFRRLADLGVSYPPEFLAHLMGRHSQHVGRRYRVRHTCRDDRAPISPKDYCSRFTLGSGYVVDWANKLLFQLTGSPAPAGRREGGDRHPQNRTFQSGQEPNYDNLVTTAKSLNPNWRNITMNVANNANCPLSVTVDTGTGGQPQNALSTSCLVRMRGLEPPRSLPSLEPESSASANSATSAGWVDDLYCEALNQSCQTS